jgi:hypothetical protein
MLPLHIQRRPARTGDLPHPLGGAGRMGKGDERHLRLGDAGLFTGDLGQGGAEPLLVVEAKRGDAGYRRVSDDVGGVEPAAHADLQHKRVGGHPGEGKKGGGGGRLEKAGSDAGQGVEHLFEEASEVVVGDQPSGQADALVKADQMGRGEDVGALASALQRGAKEGGGRALAVGPRDMEHGR